MTPRERAKSRRRHRWQTFADLDLVHAWRDGKGISQTYCGRKGLRSQTRTKSGSYCERCLTIAEMKDREFAEKNKAAKERCRKRQVVLAVLEAIRPASVDRGDWNERAKQLVEII